MSQVQTTAENPCYNPDTIPFQALNKPLTLSQV